jgi:glycosyltransferase involved in cell wall biosynthesis
MKRRILYVEKPPFVGGSITGLFELVRGLDRDRFEPVVLFHGPNPFRERFREIGVQVETLSEAMPAAQRSQRDIAASMGRISRRASQGYRLLKDLYRFTKRDLPVAQRVARLIRTWEIDLVHHNNCLRSDRATVLAARLAGVPQVVHVRSLLPFGMVERTLARSVNAFVYMSRAVESLYQQHGIPAAKGQVIYDGFVPTTTEVASNGHGDQQSLHNGNGNGNSYGNSNGHAPIRADFGLAHDDVVISNVGRMDWWKGQDYFVQSMAAVVQRQPNAKALLVGGVDSSLRNVTYHGRVQAMVQELGLGRNVIFTGFRSDIPAIMAMSDLIVHSASEPEPFGRVVVEAMLAARPVVATAAGGVLDIVEDQVTGLTVPPKDAGAMAGAIEFLLQNPAVANRMGQRAEATARTRFSVEQHVAHVQSLYASLLQS